MIEIEKAGHITTLHIARPERKNAFDLATTLALGDALQAAGADADCRCVVIRGRGTVFSAGRDLKESAARADASPLEVDEAWVRVFQLLYRLPMPSVSVVRGYAVAGGFTLAMGCDFALAERTAKFGALEMRHGFPAAVCTPILARLLGPRLGLELALFGELVEAPRLYQIGLLNRLTEDAEELDRLAASFAAHIAGLDPVAVRQTRELFLAAETAPHNQALTMGKHLNQLIAASGGFAAAGKAMGGTKP